MDIFRKAVLLGLGAASLTKKKAEELVNELIKRGEISSGDKFKTLDNLLKEAQKQEKEFERKISGTVQKVVADLGLATKKDVDDISKSLKRIESKMTTPKKKNAP